MKKAWMTITAAGTLLLVSGFSSLIEANQAASAQFLKLGAGARAAAMGNAYTSVADDVTAAYWNPAGLTRVKGTELEMMQNNWLVNSQYQYAGGALPLQNKTLAVSVYRADYGSIDRYTATDQKDGSFTAGSLAGSISMGAMVNENFSYGVSAKFLQETIETNRASTFAGDAGLQFHRGNFNLGAVLLNVGPQYKFIEQKESLPRTMRLGLSQAWLEEKLIVALDASKPSDDEFTLNGGVEYKVNKVLNVRAGYQTTPNNPLNLGGLTKLTAGIGINIEHFSIDYAFVPYGDLGTTHKFSLLYKFSSLN